MMQVSVDLSALHRLSNLYAAAGVRAPAALASAVNHTAAKARTPMARAVVKQTGLKYGTIRKALVFRKASASSLSAEIYSRGGDVRMKFFGPRETRAGVSAAPRGRRSVDPGTFLKGGLFPNRVTLRIGGGNVFRRKSADTRWRSPMTTVRSGVFIPEEMASGASRAAFEATARAALPARVAHELLRVLG